MMLHHMGLELEPSFSAAYMTDLELSDEAPLLRGVKRPFLKDMLLGAGGSALAHLLAAMAAILLPFMQPPTTFPETFLTVNLVELEGGMGGFRETAGLEGASGGVPTEPPPPAEQPPEQMPPPEPPKIAKPVERMCPVPEKPLKKAAPPPKPAPKRVESVAALQEPSSPAALSSRDATAEPPGVAGGRGQGTKGTDEGAGFSSSGGSSAGGGTLAGEFNADAVDKIPQPLHKVEPVYPPRAHKQGVCGKVVLRFLVEPDGHTSRPCVLAADPAGYFEQSALDAIRRWRFQPGIYRGKAVATWVVLPVQFKLTN